MISKMRLKNCKTWEDTLIQSGLILEPVIEEWSRQKFAEKQERKQK